VSPDVSWTLSPLVLLATAAATVLYVRRWLEVRRSSARPAAEAPVWRLCCFIAAVAVVLGALVSPLDSLADDLFSMHMVQHVLLLDLAPILAIIAFTKVLLRPATRGLSGVERRAGPLAHPAVAVFLYVSVIWAWHIPAAYDFAVRHEPAHIAEHLSFAFVGFLYWWHLLSPIRPRVPLQGLTPVAYMAGTKLFVGALGMGLAFAPTALYPYYAHHSRVWGLSPLEDQGVAGIVMAVEQSLIMGVALVALFIRALAESERAQQRRERFELSA
jgi:cytochrome c oxidase assembly factor CtaG